MFSIRFEVFRILVSRFNTRNYSQRYVYNDESELMSIYASINNNDNALVTLLNECWSIVIVLGSAKFQLKNWNNKNINIFVIFTCLIILFRNIFSNIFASVTVYIIYYVIYKSRKNIETNQTYFVELSFFRIKLRQKNQLHTQLVFKWGVCTTSNSNGIAFIWHNLYCKKMNVSWLILLFGLALPSAICITYK